MDNKAYPSGRINRLLQPFGLVLLGFLPVTDADGMADLDDGAPVLGLLLIGNGGSSLWPEFSRSAEFADGRANPLDRWSMRVGKELAATLGGRAIFPFEGPPFPPFLSWAARTGAAVSSRLSLFMHRSFGLWHAYRFALAVPESPGRLPGGIAFESPCLKCRDQPCLAACPVNAFSSPSYRSDLCLDYLAHEQQSACRQLGCASRRACPVGKAFTYLPGQAEFHMDAFVKSRFRG
jgi:hypothetical protein